MMRQRWQKFLERYDALTRRERALVATAVVGGILLVGNSIFIDLPLARAKLLAKQMQAEQGELLALQAQLGSLQREMRDPDDDNRNKLATINKEVQTVRSALNEYEKLLVPPEDIPVLLERLLTRHSALRLIGLRTLLTVAVNDQEPSESTGKTGGKEVLPAPVRRDAVNVWKHGIEIRLQGSYADLTAYLSDLERLPQRLLWGEVRLTADHPKSELHVKIFTYSLDQAWLKL